MATAPAKTPTHDGLSCFCVLRTLRLPKSVQVLMNPVHRSSHILQLLMKGSSLCFTLLPLPWSHPPLLSLLRLPPAPP